VGYSSTAPDDGDGRTEDAALAITGDEGTRVGTPDISVSGVRRTGRGVVQVSHGMDRRGADGVRVRLCWLHATSIQRK